MSEEEKHRHRLFHRHKEGEEEHEVEIDYEKEEKHHKHMQQLGALGAISAGAYALVNKITILNRSSWTLPLHIHACKRSNLASDSVAPFVDRW